MEDENKSLFTEEEILAEPVVEVQAPKVTVPNPVPTVSVDDEIDAMLADIEIQGFSDGETKDVELKEEDRLEIKDSEGKTVRVLSKQTFKIEKAELCKPILKGVDGFIAPKQLKKDDPESLGYETKMKITFVDSNYISIVPKITWYLGVDKITGKKVLRPWFPRNKLTEEDLTSNFTRTISKLYDLVCKKLNVEPGKLTLKGFEDYLNSGISVQLEQWKTKFEGSIHYRLDIYKIVD
jgi:hypothetical protein